MGQVRLRPLRGDEALDERGVYSFVVYRLESTWPAILTPAFPARVARKKVQNGIKR